MRTVLSIISILLVTTLIAQDEDALRSKKEQLAAQKVAYLTSKMDLSPDEAKVFWPVYDSYDQQLHAFRKEQRELARSKGKDLDSLSDKEVEELIDGEMAIKEKELNVRKEMHEELKELIGPRKVAMLYKAEKEFHRELLKRYKEGQKRP